jgi:hypothetical protein
MEKVSYAAFNQPVTQFSWFHKKYFPLNQLVTLPYTVSMIETGHNFPWLNHTVLAEPGFNHGVDLY